jgi:hypothetical protein
MLKVSRSAVSMSARMGKKVFREMNVKLVER